MVEFFLHFSQEKVGNTKIYTKIYNLLAIGQKASGHCLFLGCVGLRFTHLLTRRGGPVPSGPPLGLLRRLLGRTAVMVIVRVGDAVP